MNNYGPNKKLK